MTTKRDFCYLVGLATCLMALSGPLPQGWADTAIWKSSDADWWFYTNAITSGTRALGPTYAGDLKINPSTQQFEPETVDDPARRGMDLMAFNTSTQVTPGLSASRYQINSVTVQATWTYNNSPAKVRYQGTPISQPEMLAQATAGNITNQKPMELYGVGLRAGYTGYSFTGSGSPPLLGEGTFPYTASDNGYVAYPVMGTNTPGTYVDVSNSVTGGYSDTEPSHTTAAFTSTPWAVGKTDLTAGDEIPDKSTFTFSLDLNAPGVRNYVQQSLASGAFGVFLSSLHSTGEFGAGGGYPQWYNKEAAGFPNRVPTATTVPGDYNVDDLVDAADYVLWRKGGALANQVDDPSSINAQDYTEWRARFGKTSFLPHLFIDYTILPAGSGSSLTENNSVPEPAAMVLLGFGILSGWCFLNRRSREWAQKR